MNCPRDGPLMLQTDSCKTWSQSASKWGKQNKSIVLYYYFIWFQRFFFHPSNFNSCTSCPQALERTFSTASATAELLVWRSLLWNPSFLFFSGNIMMITTGCFASSSHWARSQHHQPVVDFWIAIPLISNQFGTTGCHIQQWNSEIGISAAGRDLFRESMLVSYYDTYVFDLQVGWHCHEIMFCVF